MKTNLLVSVCLTLIVHTGLAQTMPNRPPVTEAMRVFKPEETIWSPNPLPYSKGSRVAFIDSTNWPQGPSVYLVSAPAGSRYPLRWHSNVEKMYVFQGEFYGILEDGKEFRLTPGSYWYVPAGMIHGARCGDSGPCMFMEMHDKGFDQFFVESVAEKK